LLNSYKKSRKQLNMIDQPQFDRERNGSLYDRGAADSYYRRPRDPHHCACSPPMKIVDLTKEEIFEYHLGYTENTDFKEY